MTWAKFDDGYPMDRKVRPLSDAAFRLDVSGICYTARHGFDGHIPADDLGIVSEVRRPDVAVAELVKRGRWHEPDHGCESKHCRPIKDGWLIHDYLAYNPTAEQVREIREARAKAGAAGGRKSSKNRAHLKAVGEADA